MRTPPGGAPPCSCSQRSARPRSRCALTGVTAAIGCSKDPVRRVLTSQTTSASPSRATMSISPALPERQLRRRTVIPDSVSRRAARSSPYFPSALRALDVFMWAPPPAPTLSPPRPAIGSWWTTTRLWTTQSPTRVAVPTSDRPSTVIAQLLGSSRSLLLSSSMFTSLNVRTRTCFTNRAGRYMSHTQASAMDTSKNTSP